MFFLRWRIAFPALGSRFICAERSTSLMGLARNKWNNRKTRDGRIGLRRYWAPCASRHRSTTYSITGFWSSIWDIVDNADSSHGDAADCILARQRHCPWRSPLKLRACDLTKFKVRDVCHGEHVATQATIMQQKTQQPVQFEVTEQPRNSVAAWIRSAGLGASDFLFTSRPHESLHLSTRQYSRLVPRWRRRLDWTIRRTARTRCGGPRRR